MRARAARAVLGLLLVATVYKTLFLGNIALAKIVPSVDTVLYEAETPAHKQSMAPSFSCGSFEVLGNGCFNVPTGDAMRLHHGERALSLRLLQRDPQVFFDRPSFIGRPHWNMWDSMPVEITIRVVPTSVVRLQLHRIWTFIDGEDPPFDNFSGDKTRQLPNIVFIASNKNNRSEETEFRRMIELASFPKPVGASPQADGGYSENPGKNSYENGGQRHDGFIVAHNDIDNESESAGHAFTDKERKGLEAFAVIFVYCAGMGGLIWWFWRLAFPREGRDRRGSDQNDQERTGDEPSSKHPKPPRYTD